MYHPSSLPPVNTSSWSISGPEGAGPSDWARKAAYAPTETKLDVGRRKASLNQEIVALSHQHTEGNHYVTKSRRGEKERGVRPDADE